VPGVLSQQLLIVVGYYNPLLAYGEQKAIQDAFEAKANGFIVVDLPPEEAVSFREKCATARWVIKLHHFLCVA
jgi:tryptophan synthase